MFSCKLVASALLTFEFLLYAVQNDTIGLWDSLTPSFFTVIDLVMAIVLGVRCEVFIREVKETKRLVINVMSMHYDGRLRDKSKRMLKLIEETPPHFSVYDMWQLDANILLQMFMLVTGLIVTQMQFAFL
uniref:Gustatory receptor n=1 Tax=Heliothis virescens TaxID=7102 RepID=A0A2A4JIK6_HELVI